MKKENNDTNKFIESDSNSIKILRIGPEKKDYVTKD